MNSNPRQSSYVISSPSPFETANPEPAVPLRVALPRPAKGVLNSEARAKFASGVVGVLTGLGASAAAYVWAPGSSALGHMFNLRSPSSAIPVAIVCMFCWGMVLCLLRWWQVRKTERSSQRSLLLQATEVLNGIGPSELAAQLDPPACEASPLLRRLRAVVQQWLLSPALQDIDFVLQQHVVNDLESVQRAYVLARTFVWALPVLGLIGTVIGIYDAVAGFSGFLGSNVENIGAIKQSLIGVTGGLSFAFMITLAGLLTSLITMLVATLLQTREERFYTEIQQQLTDLFLPALQKWNASLPLQEAMRQFSDPQLGPTFREFTEALSVQTRDLGTTTEHIKDMVNVSHGIVAAQQDLQKSILQLHETGLARTLGDLRKTLVDLQPVLSSLRGPFVLQAVPVHASGNGHSSPAAEPPIAANGRR